MRVRFCVVVLVGMSIAGCGPSEPLQVSGLQLGRSLNTDNIAR